VKSMTGVKS